VRRYAFSGVCGAGWHDIFAGGRQQRLVNGTRQKATAKQKSPQIVYEMMKDGFEAFRRFMMGFG